MTLPNFLHIGAAKCASSWLWRVCQQHPDICVPVKPDNVNFFTMHHHRGLDWYQQTYFSNYAGQRAIGEFSNSYSVCELALQRIARELPKVKLTFTVRNPIERVYLQWAHMHLKKRPGGRNAYGFDPGQGIGIPLEKCYDVHGHGWFRLFLEPGLYAYLIERVLRYFAREQLYVVLYDDLAADNAAMARKYFEFLEVDPNFLSPLLNQQVNPDVQGPNAADHLAPEVRQEFAAIYRDDIARLAEMLGRDLSHWR